MGNVKRRAFCDAIVMERERLDRHKEPSECEDWRVWHTALLRGDNDDQKFNHPWDPVWVIWNNEGLNLLTDWILTTHNVHSLKPRKRQRWEEKKESLLSLIFKPRIFDIAGIAHTHFGLQSQKSPPPQVNSSHISKLLFWCEMRRLWPYIYAKR